MKRPDPPQIQKLQKCPQWARRGVTQLIRVLNVPELYCDICGKTIFRGVPSGSVIVKNGESYKQPSFGYGPDEYHIEPSIDTPEWWRAAREKYGYLETVVFGKFFTVCKECRDK